MVNLSADRMPFDPGPAAWREIIPSSQRYEQLSENINADWLIVGAGFAGLSAARRLQQLHSDDVIVVVDARQIAQGPAGRNSGFMIDLPHNLASGDYAGAKNTDLRQTELNRTAISFALDASAEYEMHPEAIVRSGKINAAATNKGKMHNQTYFKHLTELGESGELLDQDQMREICGTDYYLNGLYTSGTAMLQPALYVQELAKGLSRQKVKVFEESPVRRLNWVNNIWHADCGQGSIQAPKVILAVNGHAESFGLYKRRLMHVYLYGSMTRPLSKSEIDALGGEPNWGVTPADPMGTTVRRISGESGSRIVIRNRFTWSPSRSTNAEKLVSIGQTHDRSFAARFPNLPGVTMEYRWGGLLCLSRNGSSAFGEIEKGLYSACCQNGLGAAKGTSNGMLIAEYASGMSSEPLGWVLDQPAPNKLPPEPFSSIGANAYMHWAELKAGAER